MSVHSKFGPSAAEKWLNCPGSIQMEEGLTETESPYAAEGHKAHELAEAVLRGKALIFSDYDPEMVDHVMGYVAYVRELGGRQEYEQVVSYDEWIPGGYGTADAIVSYGDTLHVIDLKYGKGVPVNAYDNPQGKLYLLGAYSERDTFEHYKTLIFTIYQPRLDSVSSYSTTPAELLQWADEVARPAAKKCLDILNSPLVPGSKQCRWCKAKAICPAPKMKAEELLMKEFDHMDDHLTPIGFLSDWQIKTILENKAMIIEWLNALEAHVMNRILTGGKFYGYKIVHGRSNRKWANETEAEKILVAMIGEKAYAKKLISAPQAEKALGKKGAEVIKDLIVKPEGAPALVPDTDKRKEVVGITADDFD